MANPWTLITDRVPSPSPAEVEALMKNRHTIYRVTFGFNEFGGRWWTNKNVDVTRWVYAWREVGDV